MDPPNQKPLEIHLVTTTDSPEFTHLTRSLTQTSLVGLDAEWKPVRTHQTSFPTVSLLQIACQLDNDSVVFLLDLLSLPLSSLWESLKEMLVSPHILKLGFRFKQDLVYLSSTFCSQGCNPGFDKVEPYLDITSVYNHLQYKKNGRNVSKQNKSLATICGEMLGISLSKELQCSDWSQRPLTEEQITYAAMDAHCLLGIFKVFQAKVAEEGELVLNTNELSIPSANLGLKELFRKHDMSDKVLSTQFCEALAIVQATTCSDVVQVIPSAGAAIKKSSCWVSKPMDAFLLKIVKKHGDRILLKESDRKPKTSKKKRKKQLPINGIHRENNLENFDEWQGTAPWDPLVGGDGYPKFLCDVMVEGLAKHLRCVGIDAAVPNSKKPEPRELITQAEKEKRVLLTRDAKLLRHDYQIYKVKSLLKNEQLLEIIETFQLNINEDQLMSRCTKCNGRFIQKPLSTEEAIEAAKGFQKIPNCLFNKNLEFWQCMDCHQLYWEGTQYHNAVQKFVDICKLSD
ncbi:Polynucleotidyl transferase, ribonuclease H fold protein with HRDC domain-containing protein [Trifolium repens]|nr:Polynucleotidyl transferase, ribonuclease H fold protein with HRDC domain-containing protein [Trifolium repens]